MKLGWAKQFTDLVSAEYDVTNLACGAATTLMGLYRFLRHSDQMLPGDTVIWEYALNDQFYAAHGDPVPVLIHHLRWLVKLCHDRGLRFLPIILHTKAQMMAPVPGEYSTALVAFFVSCAIKPIDCGPLVKQFLEKGGAVDRVFTDPFHYRNEGPIPRQVAKKAANRLSQLTPLVAKDVPWLEKMGGAGLSLVEEFGGTEPIPYSNRLFDGPTYPLRDGLVSSAQGTVLGCILIASDRANGFTLSNGTRSIGPFSSQGETERVGLERILKQVSVQASYPRKPFLVIGKITIRRPLKDNRMIVQRSFRWDGFHVGPTTDAMVALVLERGAGIEAFGGVRRQNWLSLRVLRRRMGRFYRSLRTRLMRGFR